MQNNGCHGSYYCAPTMIATFLIILPQIFVTHFQDNNKIIKWPKAPKKWYGLLIVVVYIKTLVALTQSILFLKMFKFLNNIFLKENKLLKEKKISKFNFKMESSKLNNYSINMCWNYLYIIVQKSKTFIYWTKEEYLHIEMFDNCFNKQHIKIST